MIPLVSGVLNLAYWISHGLKQNGGSNFARYFIYSYILYVYINYVICTLSSKYLVMEKLKSDYSFTLR